MALSTPDFKAIISSDWSQCLSPSGPFDPIAYTYPDLASPLKNIFLEYTSNRISLGQAAEKLKKLLPSPLTIKQMDAYLDLAFVTYQGVPDLIKWCHRNNILFMINTTGFVGYFQRVFAKKLLPEIFVLSANPMIRYPLSATDPPLVLNLKEIQDKGKNTQVALSTSALSLKKVVIMGDSGGDGPHFEWGQKKKAFIIGSMTKPSLSAYCRRHNIAIHHQVGPVYKKGQQRDQEAEMAIDFNELKSILAGIIH
jgi:hypothetical protein